MIMKRWAEFFESNRDGVALTADQCVELGQKFRQIIVYEDELRRVIKEQSDDLDRLDPSRRRILEEAFHEEPQRTIANEALRKIGTI